MGRFKSRPVSTSIYGRKMPSKGVVTTPVVQLSQCDGDPSDHHLLENVDKKVAQCYLCKLINKGKVNMRSPFGCMECGVAFHVSCFTAYHRAEDLRGINDSVYQTVVNARIEASQSRRRKRRALCVADLSSIQLPAAKKTKSSTS